MNLIGISFDINCNKKRTKIALNHCENPIVMRPLFCSFSWITAANSKILLRSEKIESTLIPGYNLHIQIIRA